MLKLLYRATGHDVTCVVYHYLVVCVHIEISKPPPPQVADKTTSQITYQHLDDFLVKHWMKFDRHKLRAMFEESDFHKIGYLRPKDIIATLQGEFAGHVRFMYIGLVMHFWMYCLSIALSQSTS